MLFTTLHRALNSYKMVWCSDGGIQRARENCWLEIKISETFPQARGAWCLTRYVRLLLGKVHEQLRPRKLRQPHVPIVFGWLIIFRSGNMQQRSNTYVLLLLLQFQLYIMSAICLAGRAQNEKACTLRAHKGCKNRTHAFYAALWQCVALAHGSVAALSERKVVSHSRWWWWELGTPYGPRRQRGK